jgi:hypothetical protein
MTQPAACAPVATKLEAASAPASANNFIFPIMRSLPLDDP